MSGNAYALSRNEDEFSTPEYSERVSGYAVPGVDSDAPYNDEFGWAPSLRLSVEGIPDTSRLGTSPRRDYRPDPIRPPEEFWERNLGAEENRRHNYSERQDANGWEEVKRAPGYSDPAAGAERWARNPRRVPPPENRWTQALSPRTYSFWRPFDTNQPKSSERNFTGVHFSMADHRRDYEIYGMEPVRTSRNTFRIEPGPWDANIVDMPPPDDSELVQRVPSANVDYGSRSWRL